MKELQLLKKSDLAGISLQVWMFILSEDGKQASATKYLGNFTFE